jgi:hypothetical protein
VVTSGRDITSSVIDRKLRPNRNQGGDRDDSSDFNSNADDSLEPVGTEQRLLRALLRDYDVDARGVDDVNKTVNVMVEFLLLRIQSLVSGCDVIKLKVHAQNIRVRTYSHNGLATTHRSRQKTTHFGFDTIYSFVFSHSCSYIDRCTALSYLINKFSEVIKT